MSKTVADRFAAILATADMPRIGSIVGDSLDGVTDAIRRRVRIERVHCAPPAPE